MKATFLSREKTEKSYKEGSRYEDKGQRSKDKGEETKGFVDFRSGEGGMGYPGIYP